MGPSAWSSRHPPYAEQRAGHYEGVPEEDYPDFTVQWMTALAPKMTPDGSVFLVIRPHLRGWGSFGLCAADSLGCA